MALSWRIQKEVEGLELEIQSLTRACGIYRGETCELTEELGEARMEAEKAKKRIDKLERENAQLKKQLASMMSASKKQPLAVLSISAGVLQEPDVHRNQHCGKHPEEIFPEEVWRMIFDNLKDPKDLRSCYETCTMFQEMLEDKRKIFLLADVLGILTAKDFDMGLSSTLKSCRVVCYGWKESVDTFMQSEFLRFSPEHFQEPLCTPVRFDPNNNPWNNSALQLSCPGFNPIPSGYLIFSERGWWYSSRNDFRNGLRSFLAKFGSYVLALKMEFHEELSATDYSVDSYNFFCECLSMMPNLVMLFITQSLRKRNDEYSSDEEYRSNDEDYSHKAYYGTDLKRMAKLKMLKAGMGKQPCPNVSSLKIVYFEKCPSLLIHAVLTANPQVEKMMIKENYGKKGCDLFSLKLDMLQEASLIKLVDFKPVTWKLQKLTLDLKKKTFGFVELREILEDSFRDSLEELNLTIDEEWDTRSSGGSRLLLPNLKKLNLRQFGKQKSLDFILSLENLEELSVDFQGNENAETENGALKVIQFEDNISFLEYCNVWKLLPKLKKVRARNPCGPEKSYRWKCCTRAEAWTVY